MYNTTDLNGPGNLQVTIHTLQYINCTFYGPSKFGMYLVRDNETEVYSFSNVVTQLGTYTKVSVLM